MKVKDENEKVGLKLKIQKTNIIASGPITSWTIDRETVETVRDFIFLGSKITVVTAAMKLKETCSLEEKLDQPTQHIKKHRHYFASKVPSIQSFGFSSGHVWL